MFPNSEQLTKASQALFEAQMQAFQGLTGKAVESVQQLLALNTEAAKASAEETLAAVQQLAASLAQPRQSSISIVKNQDGSFTGQKQEY